MALLGREHPDVQALMLATSHPEAPHTVTAMPMLRASWDSIITSTVTQPSIVPPDSQAARLSARVTSSFPWLVWKALDTNSTAIDPKMAALRSYVSHTRITSELIPPAAAQQFLAIPGAAVASLVWGKIEAGYIPPNQYRPREDWKQRLASWVQQPSIVPGTWQADIASYWQWTSREGKSLDDAWTKLKMSPDNARNSLAPEASDAGLIPPELFSRILARSLATVIDPNDNIASVVIESEPAATYSLALNVGDREELVRSLGVPAGVLGNMLSKLF